MDRKDSKPDYYSLLRDKFDAAIKFEDGQVIFDNLELENTFRVLIQNFHTLIDPKRKIVVNKQEQEEFCVKLNWFYSKILYIYIYDIQLSIQNFALIQKIVNMLISNCQKVCIYWLRALMDHDIQILSHFKTFHTISLPLVINIPGSDKSIYLKYAEIKIDDYNQLEKLTVFSLLTLTETIKIYPAAVSAYVKSLPHLALAAFKSLGFNGKVWALSFLGQYMESSQCNDTIEILIILLQSISDMYEHLPVLSQNSENSYRELFQALLIFFSRTQKSRYNFVKYKSPLEQKSFIAAACYAIFNEFSFAKKTRRKSMINDLVMLVDFVIYRSKFTTETITLHVSHLLARTEWEISDLFFLLKYTIVLELEESKDFTLNVAKISKSWMLFYSKLKEKLKTLPSERDFSIWLEWIQHTLDMVSQTNDLFTRRHQIKHISKSTCEYCLNIPKLSCQSMKFSDWDYEHIRLIFFDNMNEIVRVIIQEVSKGSLDTYTLISAIKIFVRLLDSSINPSMFELSDAQKYFMLTVIFMPFYPMMEANPTLKKSDELLLIRRILTPSLKNILKSTTSRNDVAIKFKRLAIDYMSQLKMSKIGEVGTWFGTTVTQLILTQEQDVEVKTEFMRQFKNIMISNADKIFTYLTIYMEVPNELSEIDSILCLINKNAIVVKQTLPHTSLRARYEVFCKKCKDNNDHFKNTTTEKERLSICMWLSKGIIVSIDEIPVDQSFASKYMKLNSFQEGSVQLIQSLESFINHDKNYAAACLRDQEAFLEILIKVDKKTLLFTRYNSESIFISILESNIINRDAKRNFFEKLLNKLVDILQPVYKQQNEEIKMYFAGIVESLGRVANRIPEKPDIFFYKENFVIRCFKVLTYFLFGDENVCSACFVDAAEKVLKFNDLSFETAIKCHRKILVEHFANRCLSASIQFSTPIYNIFDDFCLYFGFNNGLRYLYENLNEFLLAIFPLCMRYDEMEIVQSILDFKGLTFYNVIIKSPVTLYKRFYSLPETEQKQCLKYVEENGNFKYKDLLIEDRSNSISDAIISYKTDAPFFIHLIKVLMQTENEDMDDYEAMIKFVAGSFLGVILRFEKILTTKDSDHSEKESILLSLGDLLRFIGTEHVSTLFIKVMGFLKSAIKLDFNRPFKRLFIDLWEILIRTCHANALGPFLSAIFVAIEPYIEDYPERIDQICNYLLQENTSTLSTFIVDLFFIERTKFSSDIKDFISFHITSQSITDSNDFQTNIDRLVAHMKNEKSDSDSKYYCLQFLNQLAKANREKLISMMQMPNISAFKEIYSVLIDCINHANNEKLLEQTAECFGEIGALKLDYQTVSYSDAKNLGFSIHTDEFALCLINLLCKYYKDMQKNMESLAYGIQEVIRDKKVIRSNSNFIWRSLSKSTQKLIEPLFTSRYNHGVIQLASTEKTIFWEQAQSFKEWGYSMATILIDQMHNEYTQTQKLLISVNFNLKHYDELNSVVLPYIFLHYFESSETDDLDVFVIKEFNYIFKQVKGKEHENRQEAFEYESTHKFLANYNFIVREKNEAPVEKDCGKFIRVAKKVGSVILDVIEFLSRFLYQSDGESVVAKRVKKFLTNFEPRVLAEVSYYCEEYQRALVYCEKYMSQLDDDARKDYWSNLVHIYAKLGDSDSIEGTMTKKMTWSPRDQLLIGNVTGYWDDPLSCVEEIARQPVVVSKDIQSILSCYIQHNKCELGLNITDKLLQKLYDKCAKERGQHEKIKTEALMRLSRFDELEEILPERVEIDTTDWASLNAKLILELRKGDQVLFDEELKKVRLAVMKNFKHYESNMLMYKMNYNEILHLHMLTDFERMGAVALQVPKFDITSAKKNLNNLIKEVESRKELLKLTPMQTESLVAMHRVFLLEIRRLVNVHLNDKAGVEDLNTIINNYIGRGLMECAKIYCQQEQLQQANAYLMEAENYKAPGLFIEKARLCWKQKKFPQAINLLTSSCDEIAKTSGMERNVFLSKGLLMIARYNADAAVVDDKVNREMFRKSLTQDVDREKAYLFYADYLDRIIFFKDPDINQIEESKLVEVLEAYGNCLKYGSNYVLQSLPRFLQIWFDATMPKQNSNNNRKKIIISSSTNPALTQTAKKFALVLSPYQFYTAFSQLISRISHPCPEVFQVTKIIITKLITAYPEQSMWFMVHAMKSKLPSACERMTEIFLPLKKDKPIIQDFSDFIDRIMDLSKLKDIGSSSSHMEVSKINVLLRRMKSRQLMPLQQNLQIYNQGNVDNVGYQHIYIYQFSEKIVVMNSMQRPKKIAILGSDGKEYPMLVKSKDDLRIDFRFMEVLKVVNDYFRKDRNASQRLLSVRTYTVIPINEEIGILEWMTNMDTLRNVLTSQWARDKINVPERKDNKALEIKWNDKRLDSKKTFNEMKALFPPILGKWYQQHFQNSQSYLNARHQYVKSVAIISVVGYLFGLGDRHLENMLVSMETGEIAHVDFNSMFNTSEKLPVPERVPFRLTQCMVEAMGVLGTEGSFRKCCEVTMSLLQNRKNILVSYLRPFVFDPLIRNFSQSEYEPVNQHSLVSINTIKRKLDGYVRKYQKFLEIPLSSEGHVKVIIEEATSDANLSKMYFHWNPFI